jgi:lipopolysaccharide/colanic/teichoic acid biosynthesis glycosyltransferase
VGCSRSIGKKGEEGIAMLKRALDVFVAAVALVVLSPVLAVAVVLIWLSDPGPILYHGVRIGRDGAPFRMLKLRTMRVRAIEGAAITTRNDPRVTPIGRFLRKSKLDELPQLINVMRGDMSLVGPRPEAPVYVALYTPYQFRALSVRPGITGLTQIVYRDESQLLAGDDPETLYRTVAMPAKLKIDVFYVEYQSLWLDLRIIALTALVIVFPQAVKLASGLIPSSKGEESPVVQATRILEPSAGTHQAVASGAKEVRNG